MLRLILLGVVVLVLAAATFMVVQIGPANLIGMLRYDTRREGSLHVGMKAPDLEVVSLAGGPRVRLLDAARGRPLVIVFGSFT